MHLLHAYNTLQGATIRWTCFVPTAMRYRNSLLVRSRRNSPTRRNNESPAFHSASSTVSSHCHTARRLASRSPYTCVHSSSTSNGWWDRKMHYGVKRRYLLLYTALHFTLLHCSVNCCMSCGIESANLWISTYIP